MATNVSNPLFRPGADITLIARGGVRGKTFVSIDGGYDPATGALPGCATARGLDKFIGVASYDAKDGEYVHIQRNGSCPEVFVYGEINAGDYVAPSVDGRATKAATRAEAIGIAVSSGVGEGATTFVMLF